MTDDELQNGRRISATDTGCVDQFGEIEAVYSFDQPDRDNWLVSFRDEATGLLGLAKIKDCRPA